MTRKTVQQIWTLGLLLFISTVAFAEEGKLQWARDTTLSGAVTGEVAEIKVKVGQRVKKGQVLLRLQQDIFSSRLRAAESLEKRNLGLLNEATAEHRRSTEMYDNSMLSEHELELKRLAVLMAEAEHKQAQAKLATIRFQQQQSIVTAPFDAIITALMVAEHETVNGEQNAVPMIRLVSSDRMLVVVRLELSEAMKLTPGNKLKVKLAGKQYDAVIERVQPSQGPDGYTSSTQGALIELQVAVSPGRTLYPGLPASIVMP